MDAPTAAPSNFAVSEIGRDYVTFTWDALDPEPSGYGFQFGTQVPPDPEDFGTWQYDAGEIHALTFTADNLSPGTYYFVLHAFNCEDGVYSNGPITAILEVEVTGSSGGVPVPTDLAAVANGTSEIDLSWDEVTDATYLIRISDDDETWGEPIACETNSYQHTGLEPGTTRYYQVAAVVGEDQSDWSTSANATTDALVPPTTPTISSASTDSTSSVTIAWGAVEGATSYSIYRDETEIATAVTDLSYADTAAPIGVWASYTVKAINEYGASDPSEPASGIRLLDPESIAPAASVVAPATTLNADGNGYTVGTYEGGGIDPEDIVSADYVVAGHHNYVGGSAGTYPTTEASKADQLAEDTAAVEAAKASLLTTATVLGVSGEFDELARNVDPGEANVWTGVGYQIAGEEKTGTKRASSIANCTPVNIKLGVTIGDVTGSYSSSAQKSNGNRNAVLGG